MPQNKVSRQLRSLNHEQIKCMPKRQADYFLSNLAALSKFPA
jgi:hypothetical protein